MRKGKRQRQKTEKLIGMGIDSILIILFVLSSCGTSDIAVNEEKEIFHIEIVFSTDEAEKVVPYKLQTLELSLKSALPNVPRGYLATIKVLPHTLQKVMDKMMVDADIIVVSKAEDQTSPF